MARRDRIDFFGEQKRRRRTARVLAAACMMIASGIGVVLSSVVTPLLLLAAGGLLLLLARFGVFPAELRNTSHGLGTWASGHLAHFDEWTRSLDHISHLSDAGVMIAPLLRLAPVSVPALVAAGVIWIVLRRISLRGQGGDMIARLKARAITEHDPEEHQLANIVAEMAIAAGLPEPTVLLIDSPAINAAAVGATQGRATLLVTRGLLDQLDRDETSGIVAHLVASVGSGDVRLTHAILAVFQTFGFFVSFLDLPFRWAAWRALGGLLLVVLGVRRSPQLVEQTLDAIERGIEAETMPDIEKIWSVIPYRPVRLVLLAPLMPIMLISMILRLVLFLWTTLFLGPPLAMIWRNRRFAADAMAVQLTRNPDGLARALSRIGGSAIPDGGEGREYSFVHVPSGGAKSRAIPQSLHPLLGKRISRLQALGATGVAASRWQFPRLEMMAEHPAQALLGVFLLLLLVPLGVILVLAVGYLTAIAMTLGLVAGLAVAAGVLG